MNCQKCQNTIEDGKVSCEKCGTPTNQAPLPKMEVVANSNSINGTYKIDRNNPELKPLYQKMSKYLVLYMASSFVLIMIGGFIPKDLQWIIMFPVGILILALFVAFTRLIIEIKQKKKIIIEREKSGIPSPSIESNIVTQVNVGDSSPSTNSTKDQFDGENVEILIGYFIPLISLWYLFTKKYKKSQFFAIHTNQQLINLIIAILIQLIGAYLSSEELVTDDVMAGFLALGYLILFPILIYGVIYGFVLAFRGKATLVPLLGKIRLVKFN
jgi:hypothetical protein